jgi:hypothetical protein
MVISSQEDMNDAIKNDNAVFFEPGSFSYTDSGGSQLVYQGPQESDRGFCLSGHRAAFIALQTDYSKAWL